MADVPIRGVLADDLDLIRSAAAERAAVLEAVDDAQEARADAVSRSRPR